MQEENFEVCSTILKMRLFQKLEQNPCMKTHSKSFHYVKSYEIDKKCPDRNHFFTESIKNLTEA